MSGSNPPSTSGSPCIARRAVTTSAAVAILAVALPVVLVAAVAAFASSATAESAPQPAAAELIVAQSATLATPADIEVPTTVAPTTTTPAPPTTVAPAPATTAAPAPPPTPAPEPRAAGDPNDPASWERLAQCESGGNWAINTGNGYYGGLQFSLASWQNVGGTGYPHEASKETQIEMGKRLYAQGGWGHWPGCTRSFGWR